MEVDPPTRVPSVEFHPVSQSVGREHNGCTSSCTCTLHCHCYQQRNATQLNHSDLTTQQCPFLSPVLHSSPLCTCQTNTLASPVEELRSPLTLPWWVSCLASCPKPSLKLWTPMTSRRTWPRPWPNCKYPCTKPSFRSIELSDGTECRQTRNPQQRMSKRRPPSKRTLERPFSSVPARRPNRMTTATLES